VGRLVSIVHTPRDRAGRPQDHYVRVPLDRARLVENGGIEGDTKGRPGDRQLNIMVAEVLEGLRAEGFKTAPGELGEQLIVSGVDPASLAVGARLRVGTAVVEVTIPRTGCARFEMIQGKSKSAAAGRLGVMARVVVGGEAGVGDGVELLADAR
jgi:MOSC domain-containing protein YiiM